MDKKTIQLSIAFSVLLLSSLNISAAPRFEDPAAGAVKAQARKVVDGLRGPYLHAAVLVSPARLPDSFDYLLDRPAGFDFSFPLDSFKHSYCESIPAGAKLGVTGIGEAAIVDVPAQTNKKGVFIAGPGLLGVVKRRVQNLKPSGSGNRYDYTVKITRKAGVSVSAGDYVFDLTFAETAGEWLLYGIKSRRGALTGDEGKPVERMKFAPYYENCK